MERYLTGRIVGTLSRNESGVTAIEYALIAGLVSIAIVAAVTLTGTQLADVFNDLANAIIDVERCVEVGSNCKK